MKSFILAALAGAASATTTIENQMTIVSSTNISTKATPAVVLGTVAVNSGWSKSGTGADASINLKMEIMTTELAANNFTGATDVWFAAFSKDTTTASAELLRTSFTTTAATATTAASTSIACSTVTVPFNALSTTIVPQTEYAKIAVASQKNQSGQLLADGLGTLSPLTLAGAWNPDQAGASNTATAWTMRWTRTATDASAFGAKIGAGTVQAGIWYYKGADNLWKVQAPFQWMSDSTAAGGNCASGYSCMACTGTACDATLSCKTSSMATGNCTVNIPAADCSAATAKIDAKYKANASDPTIATDPAALGAGCTWTAPTTPVKVDCTALKAAVDTATASKIQTAIDAANAAWKAGSCDSTKKDASALYSSLAAVVVGIFATAF